METKRCTKCGEVKGLEEFWVNRRLLSGREGRCSVCMCEERRKRYGMDKERINKVRDAWAKSNPLKIKEYYSRYYAEHKRDVIAKTNARAKAFPCIHRKAARKAREKLTDTYVRTSLGTSGEVSHELIEMKRQQLLAHRALKEFQKLLKEQTK